MVLVLKRRLVSRNVARLIKGGEDGKADCEMSCRSVDAAREAGHMLNQ